MPLTALALTGHIAWILLLLGAIAALRVTVSTRTGKPANSFAPDGADVSPFSNRLCRAHANCVESFPFLGGLLVLALATDTPHITDHLAPMVLMARMAQTTTHLISTHERAILIRFSFLVIQYAVSAWWLVGFLQEFLGA